MAPHQNELIELYSQKQKEFREGGPLGISVKMPLMAFKQRACSLQDRDKYVKKDVSYNWQPKKAGIASIASHPAGPEQISSSQRDCWAPGSRGALLPPSPLRTGLDSFPSSGSSLSNAPCGTRFHNF
jgi:hypothetical protein